MQEYYNFLVRRERLPKEIKLDEKVKKVVCGENHTLVLTENGRVFGCGNNKYEQLSQDDLYVKQIIGLESLTEIPQNKFEDFKVVDIEASDNCSFFITKNEQNNTYHFFSAGLGLKGTLGQNIVKHVSDVVKVEDLSGLVNPDTFEPFEPLKLSCGKEHCLLLFKNPRVVYVWGDNEFGELGTKDTLLYDSPFPMLEEYMLPYNILNIAAGGRNSAFICEKVDPKKVREILKQDKAEFEEEMKFIKEKAKEEKEAVEEKSKSSQIWKTIKRYI